MSTTTRDTAGPADGGPGPQRYLIGSSDEPLLAVVTELLSGDLRVRALRAPASGVLAVEADPSVVDELRDRFGDQLVIEPDVELEMSSQPVPPDEPTIG